MIPLSLVPRKKGDGCESDRYDKYHKMKGHRTNDCHQLNGEIKGLIQEDLKVQETQKMGGWIEFIDLKTFVTQYIKQQR